MTEEEKQDWQNLSLTGVLVRAEELTNKVNRLEAEIVSAEESSRKSGQIESREALVRGMKSLISQGGSLDDELAGYIYEEFANRLNKDMTGAWANPFAPKWTVTIRYGNETIKVIENVEADSAEDAVDAVTEDLSVRDVTMSCELEYKGDGDENTNYSDTIECEDAEWELIDELEITAEPAEA